ncbi:MAG TPA: cell division protein FtsH, partial [Casimicrobiaceae bacterium]|nr:cell division protein FtsH [Casimicrobiaceae bacterium]
DAEIRGIIDQQYALARKLIEDNREKVEAMAKALLEFETIDSDQIGDIVAGKPPRPPKPTQTPSPGTTIGPGTMGGTAPSANPARSRLDS